MLGIAYLQLVADAHSQQVAADERIGFHALYSQLPGQIPGQLALDDLTDHDPADHEQAPEVNR